MTAMLPSLRPLGLTIALPALLAGCGPSSVSMGDDTAAAETGPTWYADVQPVLDQSCSRCHAEAGIAPAFDDPTVARDLAPTMLAYIDAEYMPPPAPNRSCREYEGADGMVLPAEGKDTLRAWLDAGTPLGDPATAPERPAPDTLAPFDLELRGSQAYTPDFSRDINDYRCFRLDLENPDPVYVTGLEALIDEPSIVHHVVLFSAPASAGASQTDDPTAGFACGGFGEDGWDFVAGWAPGGGPVRVPEGSGLRLGRDAHLVLQMHYYDSGPQAAGLSDQSGYGLMLADSVEDEVYVYPLGTFDFTIPAGASAYESPLIIPWSNDWPEIEILGVFPHMHQLGSGFDMYVAHPDASQDCLVDIDRWDFHNQIALQYPEPVRVRGGDVLAMTCRWDNSADNPAQFNDPPQDVGFGEGTDEEMCFGFTYGRLAD